MNPLFGDLLDPIPRRALLGAVGATIAGTGLAQSSPAPNRVKGPRVWLEMDQQELDDAYTQSVYAANMEQLLRRYATNSEAVRQRLGQPRRFSYGPTPPETLDLYPTDRPNAPIEVSLHGGAWRAGSANDHAFPAEIFVNAGAHYVALDFINVIDAGGSLAPMVDQVRRALVWVHRNAKSFGGDPNRIFVAGHSSGAHLTSITLVTDWEAFAAPRDLIKGALCCSGIYDLQPVRLSARSAYVRFTDELVHEYSTQRHASRINCAVIVAYGTNESPEFQRQAREFADTLQAAGKSVTTLMGENYNHFELIETLANPYGLLGRAVLQQMSMPGAA